jgi:hypothetical protein
MKLISNLVKRSLEGKVFVSSLQRSHFSGDVVVGAEEMTILFRVQRLAVQEFTGLEAEHIREQSRELFNLAAQGSDPTGDWVVFGSPSSLALRNIDHLFPPELKGPYPPPPVDFLWARVHDDPRTGPRDLAAPGFWAVRGEHAEMVLGRLKEAWDAEQEATEADETRIWSQVVRDLPLRKRAFERGEVLCPPVGAVDWKALCSAAFVTIPHWPEPERWKFLQALYFGTYFGDETGMLVNLFDP